MALGSTRFLTLITLYTNNHHGLRESCFGFCEIPDDPHYGCTGSNFRDVKPTEALTQTGGTDDSAVLLPTTVESAWYRCDGGSKKAHPIHTCSTHASIDPKQGKKLHPP